VVIAGYMGCNAEAAVIMFTISIGFNGMTVPGSKSNMLDFAPKYAGMFDKQFLTHKGFKKYTSRNEQSQIRPNK
jgi:hypothetical protein